MRPSRASYVALSVAVHAALVGWLATIGIDSRPALRESRTPPALLAPAVAPEPVAVVEVLLFEDRAPVATAGITRAPQPRIAAPRPRSTASPGAEAPTANAITAPGTSVIEPSPLMAMGPRRVQLRLDHTPGVTAAMPDRSPERSIAPPPAGQSGYTSRTFSMAVAPDGTAKLRDGKNLVFHLPTRKMLGDLIQGWYEGPKGPADRDAFVEDFSRPVLNPVGDIGYTIATFDVTDWLMREAGQDPYASKKLQVLDATRDHRVEIGATFRREQLARAAALMQSNLDQLWARVTDPSERKRGVFELWEECADTGTDELVEAGVAARTLVIGVIRARLPAGSPEAFTPEELAVLNTQNRSRVRFAPYE